MSAFAFLSAVAAGISLFTGGVVLGRGFRSRTGPIFACLCASVSWWAFAEHQTRQAETFASAKWWLQVNAFWPLTAAMLLHFALVFTERDRRDGPHVGRWVAYALTYGISAAYAAIFLTGDVWGTPVEAWWGWTVEYPHDLASDSSTLWVAVLTIAAAGLCWRYWSRLDPGPKKRQAALVSTGLSVPIAIGLTTDALVPALDIRFPEMAAVAFAVGVAGFIGYAMWRYQLFSITPAAAADRIVATMAEALFLTDPDTRVRVVNPAALDLLGYAHEADVLGRFMGDFLEEVAGIPLGRGGRVPAQNELCAAERDATLKTSGGGTVPIALTVSCAADGGRTEGYVWIARDITQRREADQLKADSVAMVAHELKGPLGVMLGNAALLDRLVDLDADARRLKEMAARIREQSQKMTQLVGRMLDLSQIQAGTFALNVEQVELGRAVEDWASDVPMSDRHELTFEARDTRVAPWCDPVRMSTVVTNLVGNAVKYSPDGGEVRVATRREGELAVIEVTDHGLGIAPEDLPLVFERYKRGRDEAARLLPGSGLGLYLSRMIVEAHGGTIEAASRSGEGSTFTVRVPLGAAEPAG